MLKSNAQTNSLIGKCQKKQNMKRILFLFIQTIFSLSWVLDNNTPVYLMLEIGAVIDHTVVL